MARHSRTLDALPGLKLNFQNQPDGSQPSVTPGPGNMVPSSDLYRHWVCKWYHVHTCSKNIHAYKYKKIKQ